MHPYKQNIDESKRIGLKVGDIVRLNDSIYLPKLYRNQVGVVIERYRTLNRFNLRYWNYFTRVRFFTDLNTNRDRSFVNGSAYMKKIHFKKITIKPRQAIIPDLRSNKPVKLKFSNEEKRLGTCLLGYLYLNYNEIFSIFGPPNSIPVIKFSKTDWEWIFSLNGETVTIYNYKTGPSYSEGNKDVKPQDLKYWHIGGNKKSVLNLLYKYIIQQDGSFIGRDFIFED